MTEPFRIRQARLTDLPALWPLARQLDSYNLPADRAILRQLVLASVESFRGRLPRTQARYLFVMERRPSNSVIGCSLIIAKHGTPSLPHVRMDVRTVRMRSRTLRREATHDLLRLGWTTSGPTEIGGLIVLSRYRAHPLRLGRQLSYVRLAYIAAHPDRFESDVLVEYLPPLTPEGDSGLWRALGAKFTGLSYRQADRLSITNKEFITSLFPRGPIYTDWFPAQVRRQIGLVHPAAAGACGMLRAQGFRFLRQVEPFDGGPYYGARANRIKLCRQVRRGRITALVGPLPWQGLIWAEPSRGEFRCVWGFFGISGRQIRVSPETGTMLEVHEGMAAHAVAG